MRAIAAIFLLAGLTVAVRAQEKKVVHLPFNGPEFFCHILHSKGLTPHLSFDAAMNEAKDSMIIVFGDARSPEARAFYREGRIRRFLADGGNLLIASDRHQRFWDLSVQVSTLPVLSSEKNGYRGNQRCPMLKYEDKNAPRGQDVREHPLFQLLHTGIATNCPNELSFTPDVLNLQELLNFQAEADRADIHTYMIGSPKDAPPEGRTLVLAGHGMFLNGMMLQPDNDNFAFSINAVEWLRAKNRGDKRTQALFVVNGKIINDFNMNLSPPAPPVPMPTVEMMNRLISGLEEEDFFHRVFVGLMGDRIRFVVPVLFGLATCGLLLYGFKKFLDGRHTRENGVPRLVGASLPSKAAPPRGTQHEKALLRQADAGADARRLVLVWFQAELDLGPAHWASRVRAKFVVGGSFLTRAALQRQADFVLTLAEATDAVSVTRTEFAALVQSLPALSEALRSGRLSLLLDGKEVRHP